MKRAMIVMLLGVFGLMAFTGCEAHSKADKHGVEVGVEPK